MKLKLEFLGGGIQDLTYDGKQMVAQCPCEGNNYQFSVMVMIGITALPVYLDVPKDHLYSPQ